MLLICFQYTKIYTLSKLTRGRLPYKTHKSNQIVPQINNGNFIGTHRSGDVTTNCLRQIHIIHIAYMHITYSSRLSMLI